MKIFQKGWGVSLFETFIKHVANLVLIRGGCEDKERGSKGAY
jgi:hypothetical protein